MYEAHFGLKERPFGETVSPSAYVALPSRDTVLRRLRYALGTRPGTRSALRPAGHRQDAHGAAAGKRAGESGDPYHVPCPLRAGIGGASCLKSWVVRRFHPRRFLSRFEHVRGQLAALATRRQRLLLVIDDAHLIESVSTFEALRLLLNFATHGPPDMSLLFVGGTEVLLELPPGLTDRLAARCLLTPLSETESSTYISGRLESAGARTPLFSPDALTALHRAGNGLPRQLNHLADLALLIAYAQEMNIADASVVAIAAREYNRNVAA